jgi:hypothetical protein
VRRGATRAGWMCRFPCAPAPGAPGAATSSYQAGSCARPAAERDLRLPHASSPAMSGACRKAGHREGARMRPWASLLGLGSPTRRSRGNATVRSHDGVGPAKSLVWRTPRAACGRHNSAAPSWRGLAAR